MNDLATLTRLARALIEENVALKSIISVETAIECAPPPPVIIPKSAPPKPVIPVKKPEVVAPLPKPEVPVPLSDDMRALVTKVLPHIKLAETPLPTQTKPVALLCFSKEELPFFKALAAAIDRSLAPAKLLWGERLDESADFSSFQLVLAPQKALDDRPTLKAAITPELISLSSASDYDRLPKLKSQLWAQLCKRLSQK